jgi:hypothetical protein
MKKMTSITPCGNSATATELECATALQREVPQRGALTSPYGVIMDDNHKPVADRKQSSNVL